MRGVRTFTQGTASTYPGILRHYLIGLALTVFAKNIADNRREEGVLTDPDVAREQKAKKEFVVAYRVFYEKR